MIIVTKNNQLGWLGILAVFSLLTIQTTGAVAQESPPGLVSGTGYSFAVTNSDYLNITMDSTAEINAHINSSPTIISMTVAATAGDTSTTITLGGLEADTTYWMYADTSIDSLEFTTDANGNHSFVQDLSAPHHIRIQPGQSTYYINDDGASGTGNQCTAIGSWDASTKTCTLTGDVNDSIYIYDPNATNVGVTLDGAGFQVNLPSWGSVYVVGDNHAVKNLTVNGLVTYRPTGYGILANRTDNLTVTNVTVSNAYYAIYLQYASNSTVSDNTITGAAFGAYIYDYDYYCYYYNSSCGDITISDNTFTPYSTEYDYFGIYIYRYNYYNNSVSQGPDTITRNTISNFNYGLYENDDEYYCYYYGGSYCDNDDGAIVYQNNFIDNAIQIASYNYYSTTNESIFNLAAPDGGNYYSNFDEPAEGCADADSDGFCDAERPLDSYYNYNADYLPWTLQDGWLNAPPLADAGGSYSGNEGAVISLPGASASDPDLDTLTLSWAVDSPAVCTFSDAAALNPDLICNDDGSYTVTLTVDDGVSSPVSDDAFVTVNNVAPTITTLTGPMAPVAIGDQPVTVDVAWTDPGSADTHDVVWNWGDSLDDSQALASNPASNSHTFAEAGVYLVNVTVTDDDGGVTTQELGYVVIYDPSAGFVTGGGWIDSPEGAFSADPLLTGKANFGFVSKYKKGASTPTGNTQFTFATAGLNFHSDTYQWLVVNQGGANAQYKGDGTLNGNLAPGGAAYNFMLWAGDGEPDTFRIKIWYDDGGEVVVYDNGSNQAIGGGSIVIHTGGKKK